MNYEYAVILFFWFLVAHAVADFALQSEAMAKYKNPNNRCELPPGQKYVPCWPYWLFAHALIHGGAVAYVAGMARGGYWWLGVCEVGAHAIIDFAKCRNLTNPHVDQVLHVLCKVIWLWILLG